MRGEEGVTVDEFAGLGALEGVAEPGGDESGAGLEFGSEGLEFGVGRALLGVGLPGEPGNFCDLGHFGGVIGMDGDVN